MPREHGQDGEFVETVTLEDVLETFEHVRGPVILSGDVADRLGCSRETARRKLEELYERGDVDRRKAARRVIYWRAEETSARSASQRSVTSSETQADGSGSSSDELDEAPQVADEADDAAVDHEELRDALPGSGDRLDARVDAILAMYRSLQEHGTAEKSDLLSVVDAEAVGYASLDSVWASMVNGRDTLRALPGVEPPPSGQTVWRYVDETGTESSSGEVYDPTEEF